MYDHPDVDDPRQKDGREGKQAMDWDFSKMSSTTVFSLALLAVLVVLLVVLIIVTIKVLSKGKKDQDEEYTERKYTSREEDEESEDDTAGDDDDNEEDEDDEEDGGSSKSAKKDKAEKSERAEKSEAIEEEKPEVKDEVAAVVEAALQAKARAAELEAKVAREKADQAREEAEKAEAKASQAEAEAKAMAAKPAPEVKEEPAAEDDEDDEDYDPDDLEHTDEIPVARINHELEKQKKEADVLKATTRVADADQIIEAVKEAKGKASLADEETLLADEATEVAEAVAAAEKAATTAEDSAFGDSAFALDEGDHDKTLATSFDSAFTDTQLHQEIEDRKDELTDSAFAAQEEVKEEEVKPLQVTGETITVNPVNAVNITTVNAVAPVATTNPEAGINDAEDMSNFLQDNPVPKKKKKKMKKKDVAFDKKFGNDGPKIETARYLWYNNQDIETLTKKEDMYYYCHYFNDPAKAVLPLIIEMYDCAFVRTEEIQKIAYGIQYKSMGLREILTSKSDVSFDRARIAKDPTEQDLLQIRAKWCDYVDNFLQIIVIQAPDEMQEYIRNQLYSYGENDVETLLFCPEPEDDDE